MVHHERVVANRANEETQEGIFDVIEDDGQFRVFDCYAGMYLGNAHATLLDAQFWADYAAVTFDYNKSKPCATS